jgi:putative endonuclease
MLASRKYGTLYIGVTSDLLNRVVQHRDEVMEGFTKR